MSEKINHAWIPQVIKLDEIHKNERFEITRNEEYEFRDENGNVINATKIVLEKQKKEYPKTYEECCEIVKVGKEHTLEGATIRINYKIALLESFQKLLTNFNIWVKVLLELISHFFGWKSEDNILRSEGVFNYAISSTYYDILKLFVIFPIRFPRFPQSHLLSCYLPIGITANQ